MMQLKWFIAVASKEIEMDMIAFTLKGLIGIFILFVMVGLFREAGLFFLCGVIGVVIIGIWTAAAIKYLRS